MQARRGPRGVVPSSVQAASRWLEDAADYRSVAAQAARLIEIARHLREIHAAQEMTVLGFDLGTLKIACKNAAEAARLRQIEPRLVAQLRHRGVAVERMKIQTTRHSSMSKAGAPTRLSTGRAPIPAATLDALGEIRERLEAGRLATALITLITRQRRQRSS